MMSLSWLVSTWGACRGVICRRHTARVDDYSTSASRAGDEIHILYSGYVHTHGGRMH